MTTTFHKDNTVTIWNVYTQTFIIGATWDELGDEVLASLSTEEREKVYAHTHGIRTKWTWIEDRPYSPVTDSDGAAAGNIVSVFRRRDGDRILEYRVASNGPFSVKGKVFEFDWRSE